MKKILNSAIVMLIFCSCQKEITQKQISTVNQDNNEISQKDSIVFIDTAQLIGLDDYGDNRMTTNFKRFIIYSDADSAFPKRFTFKLTTTGSVQINSITLYIDGIAMDTRYNATAPIINDTVQFKVISPYHKAITKQMAGYGGTHAMCMRVRGAKGNTGSYELDILDFTFVNKADFPQTIFQVHPLPILGDVVNYVN